MEQEPEQVVEEPEVIEEPEVPEEPEVVEPEPEETVPLRVATDLRADRRQARQDAQDAREEAARLQGQLDAQQAPEATEKSPLEQYVEEHPEAAVDSQTMLDERKWQDQQAAKRTEKVTADKKVADEKTAKGERETQAQTSLEAATAEFSTAKVGSGLELDTVLAAGRNYVTAGEKLDINNAGDKCYQVAYRKCLDAILRQTADGKPTAEAQLFKQRMKLHNQAPEDKPENPENELEPEKSDFDPLTQFIFG